jgi:hypothetical protein
LQKEHDQKKEHRAIHHRQDLIAEAKEAWRKKQQGGKDDGECLCAIFQFCTGQGASYDVEISLGRFDLVVLFVLVDQCDVELSGCLLFFLECFSHDIDAMPLQP